MAGDTGLGQAQAVELGGRGPVGDGPTDVEFVGRQDVPPVLFEQVSGQA